MKKSAKAPSNKDRSEDALNRIQQVIAHLAESGTFPNGIRERQNRIRELARCGTKTLWKYKELWHPDFQTQRRVTQFIATVSAILETPNGNTLLSSDGEQNLSSKQSECVTQDISMVAAILEEASATGAIAETQLEQAVTRPALLSVISSYGSEGNPLGNTNTVRLNPNQDLSSNPKILTHSIVKRKSDNSLFRITIPLKALLEKEKSGLQRLTADLEDDLANAQNRGESKTLEAFGESLRQNHYHEDRQASVWQFQDEVDDWLAESWNGRKKRYTADFQAAIARVSQLVELAKRRIGELDQTLEEMEATEREIQQSELVSKGMQHQELFSRYQRNINRELYEAIDRLEEMRKQRQSQSSMGSFRQISSEQRMFQ